MCIVLKEASSNEPFSADLDLKLHWFRKLYALITTVFINIVDNAVYKMGYR